uniref:hypothetical protein n=1 Tax=Acetatifactor sp. TaxID=1872090 RepID=UPI0040562CB9
MAEKRDDFVDEEAAEFDGNEFGYAFEDELEEEDRSHPLVTAGVFLGLVVLAAILCAILWSFTHRDVKEEEAGATERAQNIVTEELLSDNEVGESTSGESETIESDGSKSNEEVLENQGTDSEEGILESVYDAEASDTVSEPEGMTFDDVSDTVTAKEVTNLRSAPTTADAENIIAQLINGETLSRTGRNEDTGWSRLNYNGQVVYAVSAYLTTDLNYEVEEAPVVSEDPNRVVTNDGREIIFTDCDDYVMPKEYVNLRTEPSTSQGQTSVSIQIRHGDIVHRTGISEESGWSRVECNGQVLYVVSSMVYGVEAPE